MFLNKYISNRSTENLYRMETSALARASDDFWPRDPNSAGPHLTACSFNSLFMAPLCFPDWDMFQARQEA